LGGERRKGTQELIGSRFRLYFGTALLALLAFDSPAQSQGVQKKRAQIPPLEREVEGFNLFSIDVSVLLMKSLSSTRSPGGMAELPFENERLKYNFEPKSLILRDVLDSILKVEPLYVWKEEKGVINLSPTENYPLLGTRVLIFHLDQATKEEMLDALQKTSEFQEALAAQKLETEPLGDLGGLCTETPTRNSIRMENATVQEILNQIVRLNKYSVWLYRESSLKNEAGAVGKKFYRLKFLVDYDRACSKP
jgi:hypothetical protein